MNRKNVDFESLISYFTKVYQNTLDNDEKKFAQKYIKSYVEKLRTRDLKDDSIYEEMLRQVGLTLNDLDGYKTEVKEDGLTEEELELNEYLEDNIGANSKVRVEYNELISKLKDDMQNPNEALVKTWVNNYKDFVQRNNLDKDMMFKNLDFLFVTYLEDFNGKEWVDFVKEVYVAENTKENEFENVEEIPSLDDFDVKTTPVNNDEEKKVEVSETENDLEETQEEEKKKEEPVEETVIDPSKKSGGGMSSVGANDDKTNDTIPADAIEIVSLKRPVNQKLLTNVKNGVIGYAALGLFGTLPAFVGAIALPAMLNLWRGTRYEKKIAEVLENNNIIAKGKEGKFILFDKEKGCAISKSTVEEDRYNQIKKDMIKIGASDYSLFERFDKFNVISRAMGWAKNSLRKQKEYFLKRGERLSKIKQATSNEEYNKYKNSEIRFDEGTGTYVLTDSEGNDIIEESESKGRSK